MADVKCIHTAAVASSSSPSSSREFGLAIWAPLRFTDTKFPRSQTPNLSDDIPNLRHFALVASSSTKDKHSCNLKAPEPLQIDTQLNNYLDTYSPTTSTVHQSSGNLGNLPRTKSPSSTWPDRRQFCRLRALIPAHNNDECLERIFNLPHLRKHLHTATS